MIEAWRYLHDVEGREPVPLDQLAQAVDHTKSLLWIDCESTTPAEIASVVDQMRIDPLVAEDLGEGRQRTKLQHYVDHFHVAVHDCELHGDHLVDREVDVVFGEGWLLSVRHRPEDEPDEGPFPIESVARRFDLQRVAEGANDEGFLLWALLDVVVDRYFVVGDAVDERLDEIEEIVFDEEVEEGTPREVFDLRRSLVRFRRSVAPLREVLAELTRKEADCVGDAALVRLHDVYDHVLRVADLVETQRELVTGLLEANLAVASNRMNQVMKRMTSWGAILLGSTLIAGIYGMNFQHMPELHWYFGYPLALGMMVVLTFVLYRYFRRRDWL